jgi:arsenite methyltransferase
MAVDVEIDVALLKSEIKKTYSSVSEQPEMEFIFPTGRAWAEDLDYPAELANVPDAAVESFAGVANPWTLGRLAPGERVLDLGSGAGTDSLIAAQMVGDRGHVTGVDMTPAMLEKARAAAGEMGVANVEFVESEAERLPFPDGSFDVVISNGVIDLIPDKDAVFAELVRVLAPGGRMQIADVTIQNPSARRAGATSICGPAELPGRCWRQRTPSSSNVTASSGSSPDSWSTPTRARSSRTPAARRRSSALAVQPSRRTSQSSERVNDGLYYIAVDSSRCEARARTRT